MQTNRKTWSQGHKLRMGAQRTTLRIDVYFTVHIAPFQGFGVDLVTVAKINEAFKHRLAPTQNKGKMTVVVRKRLEITRRITQAGEKLLQSMNVKRSIQKITSRIDINVYRRLHRRQMVLMSNWISPPKDRVRR